MTTYVMEAKENYDAARVAIINALTTYVDTNIVCDQNYQGIQWDPVRRNLMYMYMENIIGVSPLTNTTGFTLWDGEESVAPGAAMDPNLRWNSSVATKNIDTEEVNVYLNYNSANLVPAGIGGGDGTWRRFTSDFQAYPLGQGRNGPGMTDPTTGNFWTNGESCKLFCFRLEDDYSQIISPCKPVLRPDNRVQMVGFTNTAGPNPWTYAREIEELAPDGVGGTDPTDVFLYLIPKDITAEETAADELLVYATFTYPRQAPIRLWHAYNREVFDHSGNMYLFTAEPVGGKDFKLYKFEQPTSAPYGGPTVGGGFTDITPWGPATGPNADATLHTLQRNTETSEGQVPTNSVIPMYLPATDDLVLISKFLPEERAALTYDPATMFWSCTYVNDPSGTPTFDHHSAFVTGYMTADWTTTNLAGADYIVYDALEVNNYLGQSDYVYDMDYTKRWFFFVCSKVVAGASDNKARIVLVEYKFTNGAAPEVLQVIDEQGWADTYPAFAEQLNNWAYQAYGREDTTDTPLLGTSSCVATAMQTVFNYDYMNPLWDAGIYDPVTNSFWWSGGATNNFEEQPYFCLFDAAFNNRAQYIAGDVYDGTPGEIANLLPGATPPFLKLSFTAPTLDERRKLSVWGFNQDGHKHYVFRLGNTMTLVFDRLTQQWAEWRTENDTVWRAHLGLNWLGIGATPLGTTAWNVIGGDDRTGILWYVDPTKALDHDEDGVEVSFTREIIGMVPSRLREGEQCGGVYVLADLGDPIITGDGITLYTSDNDGRDYVNQGTVTVYDGDDEQELAWIGLGLITAPGRLFKFVDDGAVARISSIDMR